MSRKPLICLSLVCTTMVGVLASDWPQFLGPNRDGTSAESVSSRWPSDGPRVIWSREVGAGFSGPLAVAGQLVLHHRQGTEEIIEGFDASRGTPRWRRAYRTGYRDDFGFDEGPRATPTIHDGRVFAFGAEGTLTCVSASDGKPLWTIPTSQDFGASKGFFGFACSPLVLEGSVLVNIGGRDGAGIVAFDEATGKLRWKASTSEASYASPVAARLDGESTALFFTREGLAVLDPRSGAVRSEFSWRSRQHASVNAATPLVLGNRVFLTASYGTGAVLLDLRQKEPVVVWSNDDSLSSHYASVVHRNGYLYGFHGRQEYGASLRCVEAATGKVQWSQDGLGSGSLLLAGDRLLILTERGELVMAAAEPAGFKALERAQVLGTGTRAFPALAEGRLYARDTRKIVCLDLAPGR